MSNDVFNFNILALVLFEILGDPKFTLGGPTPLDAPSKGIFVPKANTSEHLIVFNFNFLALVFLEILGGPKFTLGGFTRP